MSNTIYTHDFIDLTSGILAKVGVLWGKNALQSINIARQTPRNPQQAIGYLGVIDYTRGIATSDLTLDCILTEQSAKAFPSGGTVPDANGPNDAVSVNSYGRQKVSIGFEEYVLTSVAVNFQAGSPATVNYGFLTPTIASSLGILGTIPQPRSGEEDPFAVVMGDDGSGVDIIANGGSMASADIGLVSYADPDTGALLTFNDGGIPAGLQSLSFSANVSRDNVLDVRSSLPIQFVTTYPISITCQMTMNILPSNGTLSRLDNLIVKGAGRTYSAPSTRNPNTDVGHTDEYVRGVGLIRTSEQESISVGQYRSFNQSFDCADLWIPLEQIPAGTLN